MGEEFGSSSRFEVHVTPARSATKEQMTGCAAGFVAAKKSPDRLCLSRQDRATVKQLISPSCPLN